MHAYSKRGLKTIVAATLGDRPRAPVEYFLRASLRTAAEDFLWRAVPGTIPMITAGTRPDDFAKAWTS